MPNLITVARLAAVPVAVWLIVAHRFDWAFVVFVLAGLSDGLDGWLARAWNARSPLGAALDPLADKALLVSVYAALAAVGALPLWIALLVIARDALILGGIAILRWRGQPPEIKPLRVSKANTALQILLAAAALAVQGFGVAPGWWFTALLGATALATLASGAAYVAHTAPRLAR